MNAIDAKKAEIEEVKAILASKAKVQKAIEAQIAAAESLLELADKAQNANRKADLLKQVDWVMTEAGKMMDVLKY